MYASDNVAGAPEWQQRDVRDNVIQAATVAMGMLADGTRLRLVLALLDGDQDVTALAAAVRAARPAVSQHLAKLRLAGLVTVRREGRRAVYGLADEHVRRLVVEGLRAAEHRLPAGHTGPSTPSA